MKIIIFFLIVFSFAGAAFNKILNVEAYKLQQDGKAIIVDIRTKKRVQNGSCFGINKYSSIPLHQS